MKRYQALAAIFAVVITSSVVDAHASSDYVGTGNYLARMDEQAGIDATQNEAIDSLSSGIDKVNTRITNSDQVRISNDKALAARITDTDTRIAESKVDQQKINDALSARITDTDTRITNSDQVRISNDKELAARITDTDARITESKADQQKINDALAAKDVKHDQKIESLAQESRAMKKEYQGGIAGAMAMAAIPQVMADQTHFIGVAGGSYADASALAVGYSARATQHATMKINASYGSDGNLGASVGIGLGW